MMTPQQEALQAQVCELPVIKELKENDSILFNELEQLKEGQLGMNNRLDKGAERMDGIEDELKKLGDAMKDGLKEVIAEIKDQKISELKKDLSDRKSSDSSLKNDLIKIVALTVISAIGYLFVKSYG